MLNFRFWRWRNLAHEAHPCYAQGSQAGAVGLPFQWFQGYIVTLIWSVRSVGLGLIGWNQVHARGHGQSCRVAAGTPSRPGYRIVPLLTTGQGRA
jgi:hypothetical protein